MNILTITGIFCIAVGILTAVLGVIRCKKRIADEENWLIAEAEVTGLEKRISIVLIGLIPIIGFEYRPVIAFRTDSGEEVMTNKTNWAMKGSTELGELNRFFECRTPFDIHYDPKKPENIWYFSKKGFRIRESIYKFILAAVLCGLGAFVLWGSTKI